MSGPNARNVPANRHRCGDGSCDTPSGTRRGKNVVADVEIERVTAHGERDCDEVRVPGSNGQNEAGDLMTAADVAEKAGSIASTAKLDSTLSRTSRM